MPWVLDGMVERQESRWIDCGRWASPWARRGRRGRQRAGRRPAERRRCDHLHGAIVAAASVVASDVPPTRSSPATPRASSQPRYEGQDVAASPARRVVGLAVRALHRARADEHVRDAGGARGDRGAALGRFRQPLPPRRRDRRRRDVDEDVRVRRASGSGAGACRSAAGRWSPLRRLHGAHEATMFVPARRAALRARDDVVDREVRARAAVLARPAVAGEDRAARDLAPVRVARHVDVGHEPDDHRAGQARVLRAQRPGRPARRPRPSPSAAAPPRAGPCRR